MRLSIAVIMVVGLLLLVSTTSTARHGIKELKTSPTHKERQRCGIQGNGQLCDEGCCNDFGYCGEGRIYCGVRCQLQCWHSNDKRLQLGGTEAYAEPDPDTVADANGDGLNL